MDPESPDAFVALDAAYQAAGWSGLRNWYDDVSPSLRLRFGTLRVHPPRASAADGAPLLLEVDGEVVAKLRARIGRGNNSDVYLTHDGRILKLARKLGASHKLLLQAWTAPRLRARGIAAANVTDLDRDGLFLVQERIDGPTVRDAYRHDSAITPALRAQLLREVDRLRAFGDATGLWIEFRDRDVFLRRDGSLVHVDCGPRVHMDGSTTYSYIDEAGARRFHSADETIKRFLDRSS